MESVARMGAGVKITMGMMMLSIIRISMSVMMILRKRMMMLVYGGSCQGEGMGKDIVNGDAFG